MIAVSGCVAPGPRVLTYPPRASAKAPRAPPIDCVILRVNS